MSDLRDLAEAADFENVRTYIQSGNLVFSTSKNPAVAKSALEAKLKDYAEPPVGLVIRTAKEMREILEANPFPDAEPNKVGVLFLDDAPPPDVIGSVRGRGDELIELGKREIYVLYPSGMGRTKLKFPAMSEGTMRNINTVTQLVKMAT